MRILVTGSQSPLGQTVTDHLLAARPNAEVFAYTADVADFATLEETIIVLQRVRPDAIVHCDIYGRDSAPDFEPADKLYQNMAMLMNLFEASSSAGVNKLVICAPAEIYPTAMQGPLTEVDLAKEPQESGINSIAQVFRFASVMSGAYQCQSGLKSTILVFGPLVGKHFLVERELDLAREGLALLKTAKASEAKTVELPWGPSALFDLTFASDAAAVVVGALETPLTGLVNVGAGRLWSGVEVSAALKAATGYSGVVRLKAEIASAPLATSRFLDTGRLAHHGMACPTALEVGFNALLALPVRHAGPGHTKGAFGEPARLTRAYSDGV